MESEFERTVRERAASTERRNAWKTQGTGARFQGMSAAAGGPAHVPVAITGLAAMPDGGLLYSMETDAVSGIFLREPGGGETRLFHTADFRIRQIALDPEGKMLAATIFHKDSSRSSIAILPVRGIDFTEVTEGDSFDQNPRWASARRLVFQSAGVGRNAAGQMAGLGPSAIQELDLDRGSLEDVVQARDQDFFQPGRRGDSLYFIRKPYETRGADRSLAGAFRDAALFPFRMGRAVFQYFNVFSMMYTGKPLVTSKGAAQRRMDPRQMLVHANLINAMGEHAQDDPDSGLVPKSWELVRKKEGSAAEVLAKGVLAYDIASDGGIVYTDGASVHSIRADGTHARILTGEWIERVAAL